MSRLHDVSGHVREQLRGVQCIAPKVQRSICMKQRGQKVAGLSTEVAVGSPDFSAGGVEFEVSSLSMPDELSMPLSIAPSLAPMWRCLRAPSMHLGVYNLSQLVPVLGRWSGMPPVGEAADPALEDPEVKQ